MPNVPSISEGNWENAYRFPAHNTFAIYSRTLCKNLSSKYYIIYFMNKTNKSLAILGNCFEVIKEMPI